MLNEEDRDPSDEQAVEEAILAALEVYTNKEFQSWADAWISGRDREQRSADSIATGIRSDWFLPDPDGKQWEQFLIDLNAKMPDATDEEFYHAGLTALESRDEVESRDSLDPADHEAEANMFASLSALAASQAAYAYASGALDLGSPDALTEAANDVVESSVMLAKGLSAKCKRIRTEIAGAR
jgi:hypothetical protein